jgi:hypothetical protein
MRPLVSYTLLFVSILAILLPKRAAKACGFYVSPGEYRFWLLQPDLTNQYDLTPFFFASGYLYRADMRLAKESYQEQNVDEWFKETNGKVNKQDIDKLLYNTNAHTYLSELATGAESKGFMRFLVQPQNKELLRYMTLSKKMEMQATNPDPWEETEFNEETFGKMKAEALKLHKEAKTEFVKFRTAFQLIRMHAWRMKIDSAQILYDKWIEPAKTNSWIKSAALYQIAINTWGLKRHYLLSKVFDRRDYNRTSCLVYFDSQNLDSIISLAKNQHERNVMYAMKACNYAGRSLEYLQQIYQSEPGYKDLQFLLLREINKVEDWLLTTKVTSFEEPAHYHTYFDGDKYYKDQAAENFASDKAYAHELYRFILKVISDRKNQPTSLLHLYAAHLCLVQKDYSCSEKHLNLAEAANPKDAKAQMQIKINRLLLHLENGFGDREEKELLSIINTPDKATGFYDPGIMKNQLILYTGRKLINKGIRAKGLMLLSRTNRALGALPIGDYKKLYQEIEENATPEDYDKMISILDKKSKTPFESFVSGKQFRTPEEHYAEGDVEERMRAERYGYEWDRNTLLNGKASWYLRNRRVKEAYATLKQVPDSFWKHPPYSEYSAANAFYVDVYRPWPYESEQVQQLNKRQVLKKMIELEELAKKDPGKAGGCYYQLANAWYNLSYYGQNWLMVRQWWSRFEIRGSRGGKPNFSTQFKEDYYGCRQAANYYTKAIAATKDKKLGALCYFLLQECEKRNKTYLKLQATDEYWDYYSHHKTKIDYKDLRKKGVDADYVEKLVNECELYQSFIRQYNRKL